MAVDTVLQRIAQILPAFRKHAADRGFHLPDVIITKVVSSRDQDAPGPGIVTFVPGACATEVNNLRKNGVLIIGGTPSPILKMAKELSGRHPFAASPHRFQVPVLIVDEASMMVQPYFLALASLVAEDGEILLAGDHRQLAPIIAHDWQMEDRPPTVVYQPYVSAFEAVRNLKQNQAIPDNAILASALSYTFRLPPAIRDLIARLYRLDNIELDGPLPVPSSVATSGSGCWERIWQQESGLFLVVHNERESKQSNLVEARIVSEILAAGGELPVGSVGIVMPHRAQRSMLKTLLGNENTGVNGIDTVERFQGGERETIIVSETASDPAAIAARAEFILSLNRANVAFSRARRRLIVVCSETLLSHIPPDVEQYASAMLWKSLRTLCTSLVAEKPMGKHQAQLWTIPTTL